MASVRFEVVGWLARAFAGAGSGRLRLEEAVEAGASVGQMLHRLAQAYPEFGRAMFQGGALTGHVDVVLNDSLLSLPEGLEVRLRDGDTVILVPAYAGGRR